MRHGKPCASRLYTEGLLCKHSYQSRYIPCMVLCVCNPTSFSVLSSGRAALKARPYLEPRKNLFAAGVFCFTGLSLLQGLTESLISLPQACGDSVCLDFRIEAGWLLWGLKLHHRVVVIFRPEWSHHCRGVCGISVLGFG